MISQSSFAIYNPPSGMSKATCVTILLYSYYWELPLDPIFNVNAIGLF